MSSIETALQFARTFLFVPGDRPDRFVKAESAGADAVIFDLEDAVQPSSKAGARDAILEHLLGGASPETATAVRINAPGTPEGMQDLEWISQLPISVGVMIAKADAESVAEVQRVSPGRVMLALIETARGVDEARAVAATPGVVRLVIGHLDLCAELGVNPDDGEALLPVRLALRIASAAESIGAPVDGVTADFRNPDTLQADVAAASRLGFTGKLCIHPTQVSQVHDALRPTPEEVEWAQRVVASTSADGVVALDGVMVDRPVVLRAESILRRGARS